MLSVEGLGKELEINISWLSNREKKLIESFDSLGCLYFLHGVQGTFIGDNIVPSWIISLAEDFARDKSLSETQISWGKGYISWKDEKGREKSIKLGKWLRKTSATPEQIKEFETRELDKWEYRISSDPKDVLTMSHNRPWVSCMRPGGMYGSGLLADIAAGSAVFFWYRPGAKKPCGRTILRPAVYSDGKAIIIMASKSYGSAPENFFSSDLEKIILKNTRKEIEVKEIGLNNVICLRDMIYDDYHKEACLQSPEEQEEASERMMWAFRNFFCGDGPGCQLAKKESEKVSDFFHNAKALEGARLREELWKAKSKLSIAENTLRQTNAPIQKYKIVDGVFKRQTVKREDPSAAHKHNKAIGRHRNSPTYKQALLRYQARLKEVSRLEKEIEKRDLEMAPSPVNYTISSRNRRVWTL